MLKGIHLPSCGFESAPKQGCFKADVNENNFKSGPSSGTNCEWRTLQDSATCDAFKSCQSRHFKENRQRCWVTKRWHNCVSRWIIIPFVPSQEGDCNPCTTEVKQNEMLAVQPSVICEHEIIRNSFRLDTIAPFFILPLEKGSTHDEKQKVREFTKISLEFKSFCSSLWWTIKNC